MQPVVETPPAPEPEPALPRPKITEPTKLTLHAVVISDLLGMTVDALPSGHVLMRDEYHFAVYPAQGNAATELHPLPEEISHARYEDEEDEDSMVQGAATTLERLHGAWPDHLYATTETTEERAQTQRLGWHWKDGGWVALESPPSDGVYTLSMTYERFLPWVKGRYLVERGLSCTDMCASEEFYDEEGPSREERKRAREIDRKIEKFKPFAVIGGKPTALPELPADGYPFEAIAVASGDVWVPRRSGAVERWNLTTKAWQMHAPPTGKRSRLAGTSKGTAYHATCEPAYFSHLSEGTVTPILLPEAGCVETLVVDGEDRPWIVMRDEVVAAGASTSRIWRLQGDAWQKVELAPLVLPGGPKRWRFDGVLWSEVEVPKGEFVVAPAELMVFGTGEVWVYGSVQGEGMSVLAREQGGLLPFDMRMVPLPLAEGDRCVIQYVNLGTLPAGQDPAKVWAEAFNYLAELPGDPPAATDEPDPHVYEVDEDGERTFYVTFGETTETSREKIQERLAKLVPGASDLQCGISPQPVREHALPEIKDEDVADVKAADDAKATAADDAKATDVKGTAPAGAKGAAPTEAKGAAPTEAKGAAPTDAAETKGAAEIKKEPPPLPTVLD